MLVVPGGFCWQATTYDSLSLIAKKITGTGWNGPRFFGLRSKKMHSQEDGPTTGRTSVDRDRKPPAFVGSEGFRSVRPPFQRAGRMRRCPRGRP